MIKKEWFPLFRFPVPADMEYFLEEKAAEGYKLKAVGQAGLFYYEFEEVKAHKCKYMVDISSLPKALYMETLMKQDWEYMGTSGNCHIWRKEYEDNRPEDKSDTICKGRHCRNMGFVALIVFLLLLAMTIALVWAYCYECKMDADIKHISFIVQAVINLPFLAYSFWANRKLFAGIGR